MFYQEVDVYKESTFMIVDEPIYQEVDFYHSQRRYDRRGAAQAIIAAEITLNVG